MREDAKVGQRVRYGPLAACASLPTSSLVKQRPIAAPRPRAGGRLIAPHSRGGQQHFCHFRESSKMTAAQRFPPSATILSRWIRSRCARAGAERLRTGAAKPAKAPDDRRRADRNREPGAIFGTRSANLDEPLAVRSALRRGNYRCGATGIAQQHSFPATGQSARIYAEYVQDMHKYRKNLGYLAPPTLPIDHPPDITDVGLGNVRAIGSAVRLQGAPCFRVIFAPGSGQAGGRACGLLGVTEPIWPSAEGYSL